MVVGEATRSAFPHPTGFVREDDPQIVGERLAPAPKVGAGAI
jgi:hypothetical protein